MSVLAVSCVGKGQSGTGEAIASLVELAPDAKIPTKANLKIGNIDMPVEVLQVNTSTQMKLTLQAHGQDFENEIYRISPQSFELEDAAGERYVEPLPLLKFPMKVGDSWKWVGTMTAGDEPHKATASVVTASENLMLPMSGSTATVLVDVDLTIESGGPSPATRKLRFWFVKDKGLVKRQFGIGSSREPVE